MAAIPYMRGRRNKPIPAQDPPDKKAVQVPEEATKIPSKIERRINRGRSAMKEDAAKRRLCMRFERGDSYFYINSQGMLSFQNTVSNPDGTGKPPHRIRNKYNLIRPIVQGKVSSATQRIPSYQVLPSATDEQKESAAHLAERVSIYGFTQWGIKKARIRCVNNAIGCGGEGFALPFFNPNVGPYVPVKTGDGDQLNVGEGEIQILVVNGNECYWESGLDFELSPWWAIERAEPIDEIKDLPGFYGMDLKSDANTSDIPTDRKMSDQLVMVTRYFERPCPNYVDGQLLIIANGRVICQPEDYPLKNSKGQTLDEPCIHRLAWDIEGNQDREFGLTWQLIDCQRTIQDALNKLSEAKNRFLMPQMIAQINSLISRRTDEPGAINWFQGAVPPTFEQLPPFPEPLFRIIETMQQIMRLIASEDQAALQQDLTNVASVTVQQLIEQSQNRWQHFISHLADWDSKLMHHCLLLAARYYTEPRLLKIKGRDGWERIPDFQGADLMGEVDVRVMPESLTPQSRQGVKDTLTWLAQIFPGWLNPQDALAAMETGNLDRLTQSYWLDVGRANTIIQKLRDGTIHGMPPRGDTDPSTGQQIVDPATGLPMQIPGYMPTDQDNLVIWEHVFADWMKTDDFGRQPPDTQAMARQVWDGIQRMKVMRAQREALQEMQLAQGAGMANAAKPQTATMPSLPGSGVVPNAAG